MSSTATEKQTSGPQGDKLADRVAFVTGGTRGIGAAISRSLAAQGAVVAAGYSSNQENAEKFLSELTDGGADRLDPPGQRRLPR